MTASPCPPARLRILPFASPLNTPAAARAEVERITRTLRAHGIETQLIARADDAFDALLIVTGGTEHLALEALAAHPGPAVLIAHPEQNSLPAALEILGHVRQSGGRGRICLVNDSPDGLAALARVAAHLDVHRRLRSARLGRIGSPSDWLVASTPDAATVARSWGPAVVDVPMAALVEALGRADPEEAAAIRRDFEAAASRIVEPMPADLEAAARVAAAMRHVVADHGLDACSVRCFDLVTAERTTGCLALSWLLDQGTVAGCEGDVPAAITMLWLELMTGNPGFMANPQDIDADANTLWLAHCTISRRMVSSYALRSHFESSLGVGLEGLLDPGDATVVRLGGADLRELFVSDGTIVASGDHPRRCRTQVGVRLAADVRSLLSRPVANHHVLARGHWAEELRQYHELLVG